MEGQDGGLSFASFFSFGFRGRRPHGTGSAAHQKGAASYPASAIGSPVKPIRKVLCRYGMGCTHVTDPVHRERFWHPPRPDSAPELKEVEFPVITYPCHECGMLFRALDELQLHLKRKTAWSNKSLVGCRISLLVDNREWHEGLVLEFSPMTGKHRVSLEHLGEVRWLPMLRIAFFIVQRPLPSPESPAQVGESKELEADPLMTRGRSLDGSSGGSLAPLEPWTFAEDITVDYARAQALMHTAYGGRIQETGHKTQGHLCVTEEDKALAKDSKSSLLYGELLPRGINKAMQAQRLAGGEASVVYELGMGIGKVAMQVFLQFPNLTRVYGVELSVARFAMAVTAVQSLCKEHPDDYEIVRLEADRCVQVRNRKTRGLLEMEVGNLLATQGIETADIVLLETDLSPTIYHDLCRLLRSMKRGARAFTYLDLRKIWTVGPFPFRQLEINRPISDRYATSWSVNRGHHFFLWGKVMDTTGKGQGAGGVGEQLADPLGDEEADAAAAAVESVSPERHRQGKEDRRRGSRAHESQGRRPSCSGAGNGGEAIGSPSRSPFNSLTRVFKRLWRTEPIPAGMSPSPMDDRCENALSKAVPLDEQGVRRGDDAAVTSPGCCACEAAGPKD